MRLRAPFRLIAIRLLPLLLAATFGVAPAFGAGFGFIRQRPDMVSAVARPSHTMVRPGDAFTVQLQFRIKAGAWFYGPKPGGKIVPAQPATLKTPAGTLFTFGTPKWPKTVVHTTDLGGETDHHNVWMGTQTITIPVKANKNAPKKPYPMTVTLEGQVCTTSVCIPTKTPATFTVTVGGALVPNKAKFPPFPTAAVSEGGGDDSGTPMAALTPSAEGIAPPASLNAPGADPPNALADKSNAPGAGKSNALAAFDVRKHAQADAPKTSWLLVLFGAFIGGLIMNVMPCVLPVVPVKVYTFLDHARQDHSKAVRLALAFAAGVISVFLLLGAVMASARGLWGAQFQHPAFVTTLGAVMFLMALWLMGAFTLSLPQAVAGAKVSAGDYAGSFGMGALATVLATPCSGPFLGGAIAWAATQSPPVILLTFATVGVGMAFPYVLLVTQPRLLKRLPKPGPWMETWKQAMGLVMFGVTVYFFSLLPAESHVPFLVFLLTLGAGAWVLYQGGGLTASRRSRGLATLAAVALALIGGRIAYSPRSSAAPFETAAPVAAGGLEWTPYRVETLNRWLSSGQTVVVEWTADWCPNCKYIENTVYRQGRVVTRLKQGVRLMRADLTRSSPDAESLLQRLGGQSIPFSAVFLSTDPAHPVILRDVYTADSLIAALDGKASVARR